MITTIVIIQLTSEKETTITKIKLKLKENNMCAILMVIIVATIVGLLWGKGIDDMSKKHPEYKGEDFLNWDRTDENKGDK
jgi:hypothetical protein